VDEFVSGAAPIPHAGKLRMQGTATVSALCLALVGLYALVVLEATGLWLVDERFAFPRLHGRAGSIP
jgi:hypothetical protein